MKEGFLNFYDKKVMKLAPNKADNIAPMIFIILLIYKNIYTYGQLFIY